MEKENESLSAGALIVFIGLIGLITTLEVLVALKVDVGQVWSEAARILGSGFWALATFCVWMSRYMNYSGDIPKAPFWLVMLISAIATGSIIGNFLPPLLPFTLWANALLWVLICLFIGCAAVAELLAKAKAALTS